MVILRTFFFAEYSPQIFSGASNSSRIGCERKISRDFRQSPRISDSVSWTFLPGREPRTARESERKKLHFFNNRIYCTSFQATPARIVMTFGEKNSVEWKKIVFLYGRRRERRWLRRLDWEIEQPFRALVFLRHNFSPSPTLNATILTRNALHSDAAHPQLTFQKSGYDVIDVEYISNIRHVWVSLCVG